MPDSLRVLVLTKYGRSGASSRLRFLQYVPILQSMNMQLTVQPLLKNDMLQSRYLHGKYSLGALVTSYLSRWRTLMNRRSFDLLWIEKEALPWMPFWLERLMLGGIPYVVDYDDAVFHHYDQHARRWVRFLFGQRLDRLMASAALVIVGNNYLAKRAYGANAPWVEVLPTVIDLDRYPKKLSASTLQPFKMSPPRIVWIGSPATAPYLALLREPLQTLAMRHAFVLRLIGCDEVSIPGVQIETLSWSEETEVADISACDVGIMPLLDTPWEQGKCGYKLIQYMACGLPVVAAGVGANPEIVLHGESGFLAKTPAEWIDALDALLKDASLRVTMGQCGRERVERAYCTQKTGPKLAKWLRSIPLGR